MTKAIAVTPYFERCGDDAIVERYVAGARGTRDSNVAVEVALPARLVERTVLVGARLSVSVAPDGRVVLHGDGVDDDTLDAATRAGRMNKQTIGALLSACLDVDTLRMEADPLGDLAKLRAQLVRGLGELDDTVEQLKRHPRRRG